MSSGSSPRRTTSTRRTGSTARSPPFRSRSRSRARRRSTATRRTSARRRRTSRHARLLDYRPGDGCSARTWVTFEVRKNSTADGGLLEAESRVLTGELGVDPHIAPAALEDALRDDPIVFETLTPVVLSFDRNA